MPTVNSVLAASYDSPLQDIRPATITRFIIDASRPEPNSGIVGSEIHNRIAKTFVHEMLNNVSNKELCKLLAKELLTLEVCLSNDTELKTELKQNVDKLIKVII